MQACTMRIKHMPLQLEHDAGTAGQGRLCLFNAGAVAESQQ